MSISEQSKVRILRDEYKRRKTTNARYSLRSYARDIGINQSLLSKILAGKRPLTATQAVRALRVLHIDPLRKDILLGARKRLPRTFKEPFTDIPLDFDLTWIDVAILDLTTLKNFKNDIEWMASRLDTDSHTVRSSLERLEERGLISFKDYGISKTKRRIQYSPSKSLPYVRAYHESMIQKAAEQLRHTDEASFQARAIRGVTLAIDSSKLEQAKKKIEKFSNQLAEFLTSGNADMLYQMNLQLFPLIGPELDQVSKKATLIRR